MNSVGIEGVVLRYGAFYGPGTGILDRTMLDQVRRRRVPLIGEANGWWSFVHVDDAAAATVNAITRGAAGIYNIVDDETAPVREWLPALAAMLGARGARARAEVAGADHGRTARGDDDDRGTRGLQCEGKARTRLAASAFDVAAGVCRSAGTAIIGLSHGRERFITATSRSSGRICAVCPAKGPSGNKCFTSRLVRPRRHDRRRPSVHVFPLMVSAKTWMVGPSPTMTMKHEPCLNRFTYSSTGPKPAIVSAAASVLRIASCVASAAAWKTGSCRRATASAAR